MLRIWTIAKVVWLELLRKKDVYVLLILLGVLLLSLVSLDIFGLSGTVGYVKDVGILLAWVFSTILAVAIGSRALPREETQATIYPLLAKPLTRWELIAGKWLGIWTVTSCALLLFYGLILAVVTARGGGFLPGTFCQGIALHIMALAITCAVSILFSTRLNPDAATSLSYVSAMTAGLVLPQVPELLVKEQGFAADILLALYFMLPRMELFDLRRRLVHGYGPIAWPVFGTVLVYGLIYVAIFLLLAWAFYRNKRFSRENVE
jgi:ABC-type transport system involved in multi-copper enzyme maturation permease subunit